MSIASFKIGFTMLMTGVLCLIRGLIPELFKKNGNYQIVKMFETVSRNKKIY